MCASAPERAAWLEQLPDAIERVRRRWELRLAEPFDSDEVSCAWVAPAVRPGGDRAVLKLGMPHMEGEHEIQGLRFWGGNPTVRVLEADDDVGAVLLERCEPGTSLRSMPEPDQDAVIARLLRRLWRPPVPPHPFRPLSAMLAIWNDEADARSHSGRDADLRRAGRDVVNELVQSAPSDVLLATDLHAGNVLRAEREPWLVIDPKPFVGDPAYDLTQHLLNCQRRVMAAPHATIERFADLAGVDRDRVRLWLFARAATAVDESGRATMIELARRIARSSTT